MIGCDLEMMRKRYEFLSELVKEYESVDAFFADKKEWFDIVGIELTKAENFLASISNSAMVSISVFQSPKSQTKQCM